MPVTWETSRLVGIEPIGVDAVSQAEVIAPRLERHHDFLERAVAGPLAQAVDRALDLPGALLRGPPGCWRRPGPRSSWQWTLMTALSMPRTFFFRCADGGGVLLRHRVADRVRDVDRRGAGLDRPLDDLGQEIQLGAGGVFR